VDRQETEAKPAQFYPESRSLGGLYLPVPQLRFLPAVGERGRPLDLTLGLFAASVLLYSQAATTRALMPLGLALGIQPQFLIGAFPSVNGYFFIPTYGSLIAAINFDLSGTTRIGKYIVNHSFMIPGLVATLVAVLTGLVLLKLCSRRIIDMLSLWHRGALDAGDRDFFPLLGTAPLNKVLPPMPRRLRHR
jgi:hypothetical protein